MKSLTSFCRLAGVAALVALLSGASLSTPVHAAPGAQKAHISVDAPGGRAELAYRFAPSGPTSIRISRSGARDHVYSIDVAAGTASVSIADKCVLTVVYPSDEQARALVVTPRRAVSFAALEQNEALYNEAWAVRLRERLGEDMRILRAAREVFPETVMAEHAYMLATRDDATITGGVPTGYGLTPGQDLPAVTEGLYSCVLNCIVWGHQADICWLGCTAQNP